LFVQKLDSLFIKCVIRSLTIVIECAMSLSSHLFSQLSNHIISFERKVSYSKVQVDSLWKMRSIPRFIAPFKFGVDFYEMMCWTKWHDGSLSKASGVVMVPTGSKPKAFHLPGYHHGTGADLNIDIGLKGELAICGAYVVAGFAVAYPNYVGLGNAAKFNLHHLMRQRSL